jgi:hypothetical protein
MRLVSDDSSFSSNVVVDGLAVKQHPDYFVDTFFGRSQERKSLSNETVNVLTSSLHSMKGSHDLMFGVSRSIFKNHEKEKLQEQVESFMKDIPDSLREVSLFLYYATQESVTL